MEGASLVHNSSFQIEILEVTDGSSPEFFYEVEGLRIFLGTKKYMPGGQHNPLEIPSTLQRKDLILKRPLIAGKTKITMWCEKAMDALVFHLTQAHILVLDKEKKIVAQWVAEDVYPKGLEITPLHYQYNDVMEETIILAYSRLKRTV